MGDFRIISPLLQANFLPDLTQVNFLPDAIEVNPTFAHFAPAVTAACAGRDIEEPKRTVVTMIAHVLFMHKRILSPIGFVCTTV